MPSRLCDTAYEELVCTFQLLRSSVTHIYLINKLYKYLALKSVFLYWSKQSQLGPEARGLLVQNL